MTLRVIRSRGAWEEDDDLEEEDRSQDRGPHFVRACGVEMRVNISHELLCPRIYRENAGAQVRDADFVRDCVVDMHGAP